MHRLIMPIILSTVLSAGTASAQCTENEWVGESGDWSEGASWSLDEPAADHCVTIADGDYVQVTQTGEACAELTLGGVDDPQSTLQLWGVCGLTVTGPMRVGSGGLGTVTQYHGACAIGSLELGIGGYVIGGGTLTVGDMTVGTTAILASFNPTGGFTSVTGDMELTSSGLVVVGSGRLQVDGNLIVGGRFAVAGGLSPGLEVAALSVVPGGTIAADVNTFGFTPLEVTGTAQLGGTLSVTDFDAPTGIYDVIVAGDLVGTFDFIQLPDDDWNWGIDGDTVWIEKEESTAAEEASWGEVKALFGAAER